MHINYPNGLVEVVCGPMFAGKTEELIRRIKRLDYAKISYLVFKPLIDDRYNGYNLLVSHNKQKVKAISVQHAQEINKYLQKLEVKPEVIIIDEAQFFDDNIIKVVDNLADEGYRVIVGGLDRDFRGEPFGPMPGLLAIAEFVTKLHAVCVKSGKPATRTQRIINEQPASYNDPILLVGAKESYEPRSRQEHRIPGKK